MTPFSLRHHLNDAYQFLGREAEGDCSILVDLGIGVGVYVHTHYLPLFRSLYGPIAERPGCDFCGYPFDVEQLGRHGCPNCHGEGLT